MAQELIWGIPSRYNQNWEKEVHLRAASAIKINRKAE